MKYPAPIMAERAQGASSFRQVIWVMVRELRRYTLGDLYASLPKVNRATVREYTMCLYRGGFVAREPLTGRGVSTPYIFTLVNDIGLVAPRLNKQGVLLPDSNQQRMWRAMKILKKFPLPELIACASTDGRPVTENAAYDYLKHLRHAQYVTLTGERYVLVVYTGGGAPMVQRTKVLFDPNIGKAICLETIKD